MLVGIDSMLGALSLERTLHHLSFLVTPCLLPNNLPGTAASLQLCAPTAIRHSLLQPLIPGKLLGLENPVITMETWAAVTVCSQAPVTEAEPGLHDSLCWLIAPKPHEDQR